ncbi:MAG TPA: phosphate starvation-inducible protein PhoH [Rhodospirillaceae bacterium]|nr:phosphate starvation-inducible protein PhoH [Rhodospirillaceae bacterium]MAX63956.1 phosphate starvation-inducible protein PhoH [Rhodospirillaceae bacterium]MBB58890.1 phosphate starvation-inducible protein PhoH [Rhodospirillaceae bacterium]HAJ19905.1 phosphate starvation-inducible protein PhoH [Rhodospirillaceae bacterium]
MGTITHVIEFEDNRLLPELFGEHDKNLVRIEAQLGITLINRGNQVAMTGSKDGVALAEEGLNRLYSRLRSGESLEDADIDAALRMVGQPTDLFGQQEPIIRTRRRQISPRTPLQAEYVDLIRGNDLVFGIGPAGTGKTYLAVCMAVSMMLSGQVEKMILSRPAVEAGERLGFLPGDMKEKVDPYLRPIYDALYDTLPADQVSRKLENGEIEVAPLAFMRGRTLKNAFVLLDEAQNTTAMQMKMFLTRLGENSRMVVTGDLSQIDLPPGQISGLAEAVQTLSGIKGIGMTRFTSADVVRHPLVSKIVQAYDARDAAKAGGKPA